MREPVPRMELAGSSGLMSSAALTCDSHSVVELEAFDVCAFDQPPSDVRVAEHRLHE